MLRRIGLQNFKCWRELDIELAPITLFFGANSSGKTALLQSLLMLKQTARGFDPAQHINFGGGEADYVDLGSYQDLAFGHAAEASVGINLSWSSSSEVIFFSDDRELDKRRVSSISYDVAWGIDRQIYIEKLRYVLETVESGRYWVNVCRDENAEYILTSSFSEPHSKPEKVTTPRSCHLLPHTVIHESRRADQIWSLRLNEEFERLLHGVHYVGPLRARPKRYYLWTGGKPELIEPDGANTIEALIASSRGNQLLANDVAFGLGKLDIVDAFSIRSVEDKKRLYEITATIGGAESSISDVGFGVSQILPVIAMLMNAPSGSIILLEQPELHLHPNAQAALADLLLHVAEERQLQLIVESHSEHIVRRLQRRVAEAQSAFAICENIRMYYCEAGAEGSTATEIDIDRFGQIPNWPERFLGDISGDLHEMLRAALERRSQELESAGSGS